MIYTFSQGFTRINRTPKGGDAVVPCTGAPVDHR